MGAKITSPEEIYEIQYTQKLHNRILNKYPWNHYGLITLSTYQLYNHIKSWFLNESEVYKLLDEMNIIQITFQKLLKTNYTTTIISQTNIIIDDYIKTIRQIENICIDLFQN